MDRPTILLNRAVSASQLQKVNGSENPHKQAKRNSTIPVISAATSPREKKLFSLPKLGGNWRKGYLGLSISSALAKANPKQKSEEEENRRKTVAVSEELSKDGDRPPDSQSLSNSMPFLHSHEVEENTFKGPSWKISERRLQTRRTRNSIFKREDVEKIKYMQLHQNVEHGNDDSQGCIVTAILNSLKKNHLCDVELIGGDGIVKGPSFLLCMYSSVIEELLYPKVLPCIQEDQSERDDLAPLIVTSLRTVDAPFATKPAISAMLHFLATQTLPDDMDDVRIMCQLYFLGKVFKINALADEAHRSGRLLINRSTGSELVCAAFDECKAFEIAGEKKKWWGYSIGGINEMKVFALDCILDAPAKLLLRGCGAKYLSPDSIQEILSHTDLDSDELTVLLILKQWVADFEGDHTIKIEAAKILVDEIDFTLIPPDVLRTQVASFEFVNKADVDSALKEIELKNSSRSPKDFEHVIVEGAGNKHVNGVYVRIEEDIGMDEDDIAFVKEATYENGDYSDFGLYLHGNKWTIASCADYSNAFYSCEVADYNLQRNETPSKGWITDTGIEPAPECHWNASKIGLNRSNRDAPCLEDIHEDIRREKKSSDASCRRLDNYDYSDQSDTRQKRITLVSQMQCCSTSELCVISLSHTRLLAWYLQWKMLTLPQDQSYRNSMVGSFRNSIRLSIADDDEDDD